VFFACSLLFIIIIYCRFTRAPNIAYKPIVMVNRTFTLLILLVLGLVATGYASSHPCAEKCQNRFVQCSEKCKSSHGVGRRELGGRHRHERNRQQNHNHRSRHSRNRGGAQCHAQCRDEKETCKNSCLEEVRRQHNDNTDAPEPEPEPEYESN